MATPRRKAAASMKPASLAGFAEALDHIKAQQRHLEELFESLRTPLINAMATALREVLFEHRTVLLKAIGDQTVLTGEHLKNLSNSVARITEAITESLRTNNGFSVSVSKLADELAEVTRQVEQLTPRTVVSGQVQLGGGFRPPGPLASRE